MGGQALEPMKQQVPLFLKRHSMAAAQVQHPLAPDAL